MRSSAITWIWPVVRETHMEYINIDLERDKVLVYLTTHTSILIMSQQEDSHKIWNFEMVTFSINLTLHAVQKVF